MRDGYIEVSYRTDSGRIGRTIVPLSTRDYMREHGHLIHEYGKSDSPNPVRWYNSNA